MDRLERRLRDAGPEFRALIARVPLQDNSPLPPDWLRCEMVERHLVLGRARIPTGSRVLEVGSGPHAVATVPIAHVVGPNGRVLAVERGRWTRFHDVIASSGLGGRTRPVQGDAGRLPLRDGSVDAAVCVHGLRSLRTEGEMVAVFREMLRVAPEIFLAESLPVARNDAQRAHLAMYDLRADVFEANTGRRDDLRYLPLNELVARVEQAGGRAVEHGVLEVDLPHALAFFPREMVERLPAGAAREARLQRWDDARAQLDRFGEDHPPVGTIVAVRA